MKRLVILCLCAPALWAQGVRTFTVTVTNLTRSQPFSPPFAVSHTDDISLFTLGQPASAALSALAEEGDTAQISTDMMGNTNVYATSVADGGPLMPGQSVTLTIEAGNEFRFISVAGMLGSTNDAFYAVTNLNLPQAGYLLKTGNGQMTMALGNAYDAGTEYNSEDCDFIPGPPCGSGGVRDTENQEGYVYIHPGISGLADMPASYDWRNPVAMVTIEVQ